MKKKSKRYEQSGNATQAEQELANPLSWNSGKISFPNSAQISLLMAELGRKGGRIGGKRRLETMTAKQRSTIAKKAAQTRWARKED